VESGVRARRGRVTVVRTGHHAGSVVLCEAGGVWPDSDGLRAALGFNKKIAMIGHGDSFQKVAQLKRRRGAGAGGR
jgi:hypothetical protein